ncbi:hypothetical protein [Janthinobacterium lividum]|uniref:Apea-like HEPN domain-containing protein n=1 Tax=Janthinobacterium lividum TaxID=29581 RepID=A0ABU0XNB8_9BURK|nr:hypothetical protein [Janthinobacterium lividum]MDQ4625019.1 hypothetical protein [Janthinobacterium lividum]MDQ4673378.1 hypothetical protein [Janthinobacterium lividum]MDQ4684108.1 hypothetical protein [Janthinobacterium lividum]
MTQDRFFPDLYKRSRKTGLLESGAKAIQTVIDEMGVDATVEEKKMLSFINMDGYVVRRGNCTAFFPRKIDLHTTENNGVATSRRNFLDIDVVLPPYVTMGYLSIYGARIEKATSGDEKERVAEEMLHGLYSSPSVLAELCLGVYQKDPCIAPFYYSLVEAIEAHCLGLPRASVLTLIPCVEGIIRNLARMVGKSIDDRVDAGSFLETLTRVQKHYINKVELRGIDWVPNELREVKFYDGFHELIQMVESIRVFVEHSMYKHTDDYEKKSRLNRHGIVHGLLSDYNTETNFYRLIVLINGLSVASIVAGRCASLFHPESTEEARLLGLHFESCKLTSFKTVTIA